MGAPTRTVSGTSTLSLIQQLDDGSAHLRAWHISDRSARTLAAVLGQPDVESVTGPEAVAAGRAMVHGSGQYAEVRRTRRGGRRG